MITYGYIREAFQAPNGVQLMIVTEGANAEELDKLLHEKRVEIEIRKPKRKRSLTANSYFWVLVQGISGKLHTDHMTQYIEQLKKYGAFVDCAVIDRAVPTLRDAYRYTEIMDTGMLMGEPASVVRCYRGSSTYTVEEMGRLIDGTVEDAKDLGIDVLPPDEIRHLVEIWKGAFGEIQ